MTGIRNWIRRDAAWWQFWRPQSGFVGGAIAGLIALMLLAMGCPAHAQFANQATYAGAASGTNAQAITLPNMVTLSDIVGVPITWVPAAGNTGATTLAINGGTATAVQKPSGAGLTALSGAELQAGQPVMSFYNGTVHVLLAINGTVNTAVTPNYLANSALSFTEPYNLQCSASVGSNALTVSVLTANGSTPSATSPVLVPVRDVTIANGDPVIVSVTGTLSITVPSGATVGTVSGQASRLWVGLFPNAGTPVLGVWNSLNANATSPSILSWDSSSAPSTTTAISAGAGSAQVWYTQGTGLSAKTFTPLCYVESTQTTAGTWATSPSKVQLMGPGVRKPGDTVQEVSSFGGTTGSITPYSAANVIRIDASGNTSVAPAGTGTVQIKRGATGIGLAFGLANAGGVSNTLGYYVRGYDQPNAVTSQTYTPTATSSATISGNQQVNMAELQI
jgi:hypothetical protein